MVIYIYIYIYIYIDYYFISHTWCNINVQYESYQYTYNKQYDIKLSPYRLH